MTIDAILTTLASAASFLKKPVEDVAARAAKDVYEKTKTYLREKFSARPDALDALSKLEEKPESEARRAFLAEEAPDLDADVELQRLVEELAALLPVSAGVTQKVSVRGNGNKVQVAGGNIYNAEKVLRKNQITPDAHHITGDQATQLRELNAELAQYLADEMGKPDYAAGFRALEKEYDVSSYLLIPRTRFEDAVTLLKQRRAMNRPKLRRRNPTLYQNDFFRGIWSRAGELGWEKPTVYHFAFVKLGLQKPITSLKALGPNQLKALSEFMQREVNKS